MGLLQTMLVGCKLPGRYGRGTEMGLPACFCIYAALCRVGVVPGGKFCLAKKGIHEPELAAISLAGISKGDGRKLSRKGVHMNGSNT